MKVPMLNEEEFTEARRLYGKGFKPSPGKSKVSERFSELVNYYNELSGWNETVANAIMHHRIEDYGADCPSCSKPLRTKKARYCAACGFGKEDLVNGNTQPLMIRRKDLFKSE